MPLLEIQNISLRFGGVIALKNVSFSVQKSGELFPPLGAAAVLIEPSNAESQR